MNFPRLFLSTRGKSGAVPNKRFFVFCPVYVCIFQNNSYVCSHKEYFYQIIMINISSLLHIWQLSWLTDFLVSWVNALLEICVQDSHPEQVVPAVQPDIVSWDENIPTQSWNQGAYILPDLNWLG